MCPTAPPVSLCLFNRGVLMSSLADRIGFFLGTHGPSLTIDTACSSTLSALATAVAFLRKGDCDTALVVTASVRSVHRYLLVMQVGTSPLGCGSEKNPRAVLQSHHGHQPYIPSSSSTFIINILIVSSSSSENRPYSCPLDRHRRPWFLCAARYVSAGCRCAERVWVQLSL